MAPVAGPGTFVLTELSAEDENSNAIELADATPFKRQGFRGDRLAEIARRPMAGRSMA
jgi:hypothetical protein